MLKLDEYKGKELLKEVGIDIPRGDIASRPEKAAKIAEKLNGPVVIKSLVESTGRFKAGLIKFANNPDETKKIAEELLEKKNKGLEVKKLLVEEKLEIEQEFYVGIIVDDSYKVKGPVLMFSAQGGIDFEELSEEKVATLNINILDGLTKREARLILRKLKVPSALAEPVSRIAHQLYKVFRKYDCRSAEINPLVVTKNGKIYAADCKIIIDDASIFRHPELNIDYLRDIGRSHSELEKIALEMEEKDYRGTGHFVQLVKNFEPGQGYIGFHAIGGGAVTLGLEALKRQGLNAANIADTSGNPPASKIYRVIKLIFSQPNIDGYALFGAVIANQEQWHHAHALIKALREELKNKPNFPVIILIAGNKEKESIEILKQGLKGFSAQVEIYGRDYVYKLDYLVKRMKKLAKDYRGGN